MNIKEAVKKAYDNLPEGGKTKASEIHGITAEYFKRIVNGTPKDIGIYYTALSSIKKAAKYCKKDTDLKVSVINSINVEKGQNPTQRWKAFNSFK